jgi:cytidylate kinase
VTASVDTRLRRLADGVEHDARSAPKHLREADRARETYLKRFYGVNEELPTHYDLVVNTDRMEPEAAAEAIVNAAVAA